MLTQRDVTWRAELEAMLAELSESQISLMSQIFPRHVIDMMTAGMAKGLGALNANGSASCSPLPSIMGMRCRPPRPGSQTDGPSGSSQATELAQSAAGIPAAWLALHRDDALLGEVGGLPETAGPEGDVDASQRLQGDRLGAYGGHWRVHSLIANQDGVVNSGLQHQQHQQHQQEQQQEKEQQVARVIHARSMREATRQAVLDSLVDLSRTHEDVSAPDGDC